jgi:hypothetical protein
LKFLTKLFRGWLKQQQTCKSIPPNIHTRFSTSAEAKESRSIPTSIQDFQQSVETNASTLASESKLKIPASSDDSCLSVPVTCSMSDPLWMFAAFKSEHINEEIGVWLSRITNLEDIRLSKVRIH